MVYYCTKQETSGCTTFWVKTISVSFFIYTVGIIVTHLDIACTEDASVCCWVTMLWHANKRPNVYVVMLASYPWSRSNFLHLCQKRLPVVRWIQLLHWQCLDCSVVHALFTRIQTAWFETCPDCMALIGRPRCIDYSQMFPDVFQYFFSFKRASPHPPTYKRFIFKQTSLLSDGPLATLYRE